MRKIAGMGLLLAVCLLTGCQKQMIAQQMVISSMTVDVAASPWKAVLEVAREKKNDYVTVEGDSFYDLFSRVEQEYDSPIYLGALENILMAGVKGSDEMLSLLQSLQGDSRIASHVQIALCDAADEFYSDTVDGSAVTALLTRQYTRGNDHSLKELLNQMMSAGRGTLIPMVAIKEGKVIIDGIVPSSSSEYGTIWQGNAVAQLLTEQETDRECTVMAGVCRAHLLLKEFKIKKVELTGDHPTVTVAGSAVLQMLERQPGHISKTELKNALEKEVLRQLLKLHQTVVEEGTTDLFGIEKRAQLQGISHKENLAGSAIYRVDLLLSDPKGLLED